MKRILFVLPFLALLIGAGQAPRVDRVENQAKGASGFVAANNQPIVALPKIAAPNTTVLNRAQVTDFANDLMPKFGVDRIMTQQIVQVQGETGQNGELVWKPVNDIHDQVRFVGTWAVGVPSFGSYIVSSVIGDYVEIVFYGTGLNILTQYNALYDWRITVDGGTESGQLLTVTGSNVIGARNYAANSPVAIASGLAAGLHTVKIRNNSANAIVMHGYEVINSSSTIALVPGTSYANGQKLTRTGTGTMALKTTFENIADGSVGTKGGHALAYQKSDGSMAKAFTPTDATAKYLTNADHTNEEITRTYNWREFGSGRSDDFSLLSGASPVDRAFTLDDGTTTLVGKGVAVYIAGTLSIDFVAGNFLTLTFVGTGLDVQLSTYGTGAKNIDAVIIDGAASSGSISMASGVTATYKVASGLPYGTHTAKFAMTTAAYSPGFLQFNVYAPKTPTLPTGAVAIADYFVMATYGWVANGGSDPWLSQSSGVLSKTPTREVVYTGTWGSSSPVGVILANGLPGGFYVGTATVNDTAALTFTGTGFEVESANNQTVSPTWNMALSTNGGAYVALGTSGTQAQSNCSYNSTTSVLTQTNGGYCRFSVSGLAYGTYSVRMTLASAATSTSVWIHRFNVITPIHAPKLNGPYVVQNTLSIGSQSIRDLRQFSPLQGGQQRMTAQAVGVVSAPTTTSTSATPLADMSSTIKTTGCPLQVMWENDNNNNTTNGNNYFQVYMDGVAQGSLMRANFSSANAGYPTPMSSQVNIPASAGYHKIDLYWMVATGTAVSNGVERIMSVREICN